MTRILVVDDDSFYRSYVRACLEYLRHKVVEAVDGIDGIAEWVKCQPDLIITDIFMPNRDGIDFIRELRRTQAQAKSLP